ncbi:MAG: hypothetical protein ACOC8B_00345 [Gemmatimonadota bacterium]
MARHNREGRGSDQRGYEYTISYQPDWLRWVKVTRALESGRQSTKLLFRNPGTPQQPPGHRVRTRITSPDQGLDFEVTIDDPDQVVKRIVVETERADALAGAAATEEGEEDQVTFTIEDRAGPPNGGNGDDDDDEEDGGT